MAKYKKRVVIHGLPKMINASSRNSWRSVYGERKKWKTLVIQSFFWIRPRSPLTKAVVTIIRHSSKEPDYDGLVSGAKALLDGLVESKIIIDDKMSVIGKPNFSWVKCSPKAGRVEIIVEEI